MPTWAHTINVSDMTAASLKIPSSPSSAPIKLKFGTLQPTFDNLWNRSNSANKEYGCIIVSKSDGVLKTRNVVVGKHAGVEHDLSHAESETYHGTFHTHPFEDGETGGAFSAGDVSFNINKGKDRIQFVQSGSDQFLLMRSQRTPTSVPFPCWKNNKMEMLKENASLGWGTVQRYISKKMANELNMAYYEGTQGIFWRVHPPISESEIQAASSKGSQAPASHSTDRPRAPHAAAAPTLVRPVPSIETQERGSIIDCMALMTGKDVGKVKRTAERVEGYDAENGLTFKQVQHTLKHLGISSSRHKERRLEFVARLRPGVRH